MALQLPVNVWRKRATWSQPFPVIGKGTFLFNVARSQPFRIVVCPPDSQQKTNTSFVELIVGIEEVSLTCKINDTLTIHEMAKKPHTFFGNNIGIEDNLICTYWLSYDSDRMVIKYGKGYRMEKTTILEKTLYSGYDETLRQEIKDALFYPTMKREVEIYDIKSNDMVPSLKASVLDTELTVDFDSLPLVSDRPAFVKNSSTVNMFDLDEGLFTYSASLPKECLELYTNVTAENVNMTYKKDDSDPDFNLVDAIRKSIQTPGALLHEILESKKDEFVGGDPNETYIRITLGQASGNSPGVPYVMEIWPSCHRSPIHNHGNAYAVIRVLHGGLTVKVYNKMSSVKNKTATFTGIESGFLFDFPVKKDDVTWISPNWYQTHKLCNKTGDVCVTIQSYQYGENDNTHWPNFDYLASCNVIEEFEPKSDLSFTEMYSLLQKEFCKSKT